MVFKNIRRVATLENYGYAIISIRINRHYVTSLYIEIRIGSLEMDKHAAVYQDAHGSLNVVAFNSLRAVSTSLPNEDTSALDRRGTVRRISDRSPSLRPRGKGRSSATDFFPLRRTSAAFRYATRFTYSEKFHTASVTVKTLVLIDTSM
jgi:hypothetical protein